MYHGHEYQDTFSRYAPLFKRCANRPVAADRAGGLYEYLLPRFNVFTVLSVANSLFLAISGSTILNMWYDRDIDARMERTAGRPIPSGQVSPAGGLRLGLLLSLAGVAWAVVDGSALWRDRSSPD